MKLLLWSVPLLLLQVAVAEAQCINCTRARYWEIDSDHWRSGRPADTPEKKLLDSLRPHDVGVAFSGGGNRASTAALGQLRGMQRNGWLQHVRYISAVSGGAWGAVPYTFFHGSVDSLLGVDVPLTVQNVDKVNGRLAGLIAGSGLYKLAAWEVPSFLPDSSNRDDLKLARKTTVSVRRLTRKLRGTSLPDEDRLNKSYAHVLGQTFLETLIRNAVRSSYAWNDATAREMSKLSERSFGDFLVPPADRPFLLVGATLVKPGGDYPSLIPVEYTPLYTGVRQQFGTLGGTYVWPWAYDRQYAAPSNSTHVLVGPSPGERIFTLADMIASTGAAPQLALIIEAYAPEQLRGVWTFGAGLFPSFSNLTVRGGEPAAPTAEIPHGDGGFVDNLALMPLIVRQVHNIIVFVNSSERDYRKNTDLQSYFMRVGPPGPSGNKRLNEVFDATRYVEVIKGLDASVAAGRAALYCGQEWKVESNETYNSSAYDGLNICWVYNHAATNWLNSLPDSAVRSWIGKPVPKKRHWWSRRTDVEKRMKALSNFPHFSTFGQNKPELIQLKPFQVNLLSDLTSWSITNEASVDAILKAFAPNVLPRPQGTR